MVPVMWGLFRLVIWADRLHAWQYSQKYPPPTPTAFTRAAVVYWTSLLTPVLVGCVAAIMSFRRRNLAAWPVPEIVVIALPYVSFATGSLLDVLYGSSHLANILWLVMLWSCILVGGAVVATFSNLGASVCHRTWGKCALSLAAVCAGMLYLFWLSTFIIYIDT